MTQPIGYYVTTWEADQLQERYGSYLQYMSLQSLKTFRCALDYIVLRLQWASINHDDWRLLVQIAIKCIDPCWEETDANAFWGCKHFCTEEVDGRYVAIPYLNSMIHALTDAIQCHPDYRLDDLGAYAV